MPTISANRRIESALLPCWRRMISPSVVGSSATCSGYVWARSARVRRPNVEERTHTVVQHIVLLKWKPGVSEKAILQAFDHAKHLPNEIDGVESLTIGRARVDQGHGFTHALIVRLRDEAALSRYLDHPRERATSPITCSRSRRSASRSASRSKSRCRGNRRVTGNSARASGWDLRSSSERRGSAARRSARRRIPLALAVVVLTC